MDTTNTQPEKKPIGWLYPWLVVAFGSLALVVSNGLTVSGITAFDTVLLEEFGWDRPEYKIRESLTLMFAGILAPGAGYFLDRYGVRKCMMVGWVVLIGCMFAYPVVGSLNGLYFLHILFALVLVLCGLNAVIIVASSWFVNNRGRAIGLVLVGTSLGGAAVTQFNTVMIEAIGWQNTLRSGAVFPLVLLLLTWFWLRETPPEGELPTASTRLDTGAAPAGEGMEYLEALKTRSFWLLSFLASGTFFTILGVQNNMRLHLIDMGFGEQGATNIFALFFFAAIAGKFLFGFVADYLKLRWVFNINIVVMFIGMLLISTMSEWLIFLAVVAFGFGWGGVYTMLQLSVLNIFGLRNAGKILGTITVLDAFGGALGIYLVAAMQKSSGSYEQAFYLCSGLILVGLVCFTGVRFRSELKTDTAPPAS